MKKFIFMILIVGVSSLLGQNYLSPAVSAKKVKTPDEIEILVNDLLLEKRAPVHYQQVQEPSLKEGKYFVQMFAYSLKKPAGLIRKIRQKGYDITTQTAWRKNKQVNLLLVGPYASRGDIKQYLSDLRSISKGAFIYVSK